MKLYSRFALSAVAALMSAGLVLGSSAPAVAGPGDLPVITSSAPPNVIIGVPYSHTFTAAGDGPFVFALDATIAGLSLDAVTGVLSGTATTFGAVSLTLTVTDIDGDQSQQAYVVPVSPGVGITTVTVPTGTTAVPYSATLAALGADPFEFRLTGGTLPPGLALSLSGAITGTPTMAGSFSFQVTVTDSNGREGARNFTLTVINDPDIVSGAPVDGTIGVPYSHTVTASGTGPFGFAVTAGALPGGLALDPDTGVIAGTPTAAGAYTFSVTVTNASAASIVATYEITIAAGTELAPTGFEGIWLAALAGMLMVTGALALRVARRTRS
jgi:Putative Ig domain.